MNLYTNYDYLCNEPISIEGIGAISCPTLRDIRKISYRLFTLYVSILDISLDEYCKAYKPEHTFDTLYETFLFDKPQLLYGLIKLFIKDNVSFSEGDYSFSVFEKSETDDGNQTLGNLNKENFESFRAEVRCVLGLAKPEEKEVKFKNEYARKMYEDLRRNESRNKPKRDEDYELDNMIRKYCTHNKVGINILNVWDMTYYQFTTMFNEYCNARQYDFNDLMAANTFSYKKSSDYKPGDYMKKLQQ